MTCKYLILAAGYYKYDEGYRPDFAGIDRFKGAIVHPNQWPEDLDYEGKNVIVIGSGATAVTLVPNMAKQVKHVTMVQRSPTYMVALPAKSILAKVLFAILPDKVAYRIARAINIGSQELFVRGSQLFPNAAKRMFVGWVRSNIGEELTDKHFTPKYNPWSQRLCLTPDGDLFEAIKSGTASVETGEVDTFTENGLKLKSGQEIDADIIVTATGFNLQFQGGVKLTVDQKPVEFKNALSYRGFMISNVPNMFYIFGYFFASWTLKLDAVFNYIFRIINRMEKNKEQQVVASMPTTPGKTLPVGGGIFTPGYIMRAKEQVPGEIAKPWASNQTYIPDVINLKFGSTNVAELEYK